MKLGRPFHPPPTHSTSQTRAIQQGVAQLCKDPPLIEPTMQTTPQQTTAQSGEGFQERTLIISSLSADFKKVSADSVA